MKIVLIEPASSGLHVYTGFKLPRLGLPIISAILKKLGHTVIIFHEESSPLDWEIIKTADLAGISTITCTAPRSYEIADRIRKENIRVMMGGPHVTFLPDEALEHADFVVRKEGEETIAELVNFLSREHQISELEKIKGLSFSTLGKKYHNPDRPLISDLSKIPFPDIDSIIGWGNKITPFQFSRGCPFHCSFCSVTKMFGHGLRYCDTKAMADEIIRRNPQNIFFYDDNFTANKEKTRELLGILKERKFKVPWTSQNRPDVADDQELLRLMKDTGCKLLYIGLESVNPETLKNFRKGQSVEQISEAVKMIHSFGINIHGMFVIGSDFDTEGTITQTVRIAIKLKLFTILLMMLTPLPGTEVFTKAEKNGQLIRPINWEHYDGHHVVLQPKKMTPWQLQKETLKGMFKFFSFSRWWKLVFQFKIETAWFNNYGRKILKQWKKRIENKEFLKKLKTFYAKTKPD